MKISGFTFIHNAINGGYPIVEAIRAVQPFVDEVVVVDMESDDGTRALLERLDVRILDGKWTPGAAGKCLQDAHAMYKQCDGDVIVHFEGDEVFSHSLLFSLFVKIEQEICAPSFLVWRLQVEQNFQRIRWYPELVHRVFPKESTIVKEGHTTNKHNEATETPCSMGFLWDVTNCFRDNWVGRIKQQAELRDEPYNFLHVPLHAGHPIGVENVAAFLSQPHWEWTTTPLDIPDILRPLVGQTRYSPNV